MTHLNSQSLTGKVLDRIEGYDGVLASHLLTVYRQQPALEPPAHDP